MRTRSTVMTNEHDSATAAAASLLATGEACEAKVSQSLRVNTDAHGMPVGVVGDSRSGKEGVCECRRAAGTNHSSGCPAEVRAAVRAEKWGNAHGAKGGRKANAR